MTNVETHDIIITKDGESIMRFDNVEGGMVCGFICVGSTCNSTCCMQQALGRCYSIAEAWNCKPESRAELLRVMKWRIDHGERTMAEANKIGLRFSAEVV